MNFYRDDDKRKMLHIEWYFVFERVYGYVLKDSFVLKVRW